uniref:Uncharacterized protein n=1 Tax=Anguilla anguilla TaxID=7936 RepID=A0A0E9RSF1_ANGAN
MVIVSREGINTYWWVECSVNYCIATCSTRQRMFGSDVMTVKQSCVLF